jgi:hypothetical protein
MQLANENIKLSIQVLMPNKYKVYIFVATVL